MNATADLTVTPADVSMWATDRGIDTTINEARKALEDMLKQGQEYFQQIGRNLSDAADQYERDDEQGKHELHESQ